MAKKTSIHIKPCKVESAEAHNKREKPLDYVIQSLTKNNEVWSNGKRLAEIVADIRQLVKEKTGRKMQQKAVPLHEAVVVIDEKTTMEDLKRVAARFKARFGIDCVQIAVHRDEGKNPQHLNLHAHMVFCWYDYETGRSIKTSKADAAEMQTICAEELRMERGVSSDKEHLDAQRYKAKAIEEELKELNLAKEAKKTAATSIKAVGEAIKGLVGQSSKDEEITALRRKNELLRAESATLQASIKAKDNEIGRLRGELDNAKSRVGALQGQLKEEAAAKIQWEEKASINQNKADMIDNYTSAREECAEVAIDYVKGRRELSSLREAFVAMCEAAGADCYDERHIVAERVAIDVLHGISKEEAARLDVTLEGIVQEIGEQEEIEEEEEQEDVQVRRRGFRR